MPKLTVDLELKGDQKYKQALKELNSGNAVLRSEMVKLQEEYKNNADSVEFLNKKGDLLQRQLQQQQDKVNKLREAVEYAAKEYGESSTKTQDYVKQLNYAEAAQFKLEHAIEENNEALKGEGTEMTKLGDTLDSVADKLGVKLPKGAKDALNGMQGFSAGTVAAMTAAAAAIAAVAKAVSELTKLTLDVAAQVDEYIAQSSITGVPTEILQAWDYAAPLIDVDAESIKNSMTKITKAIADADDGTGAAAEAFERLGISVRDSVTGNFKSAEEVFFEVVDSLGEIEDRTERDALAMELLGKSAQELNPLIEAGSDALKEYAKDAKDLGYVLDSQQIKKLGEVDDAYQQLKLTIEANRRQLAADFAPAAKEAMEVFSAAVKKAGEMLQKSGLIENIALILKSLISIISNIGEVIANLPGLGAAFDSINVILKATATFLATIADAMDLVAGVLTGNMDQAKTALGWNRNNGQMSHTQQVLYGDATGFYQDPETGLYVGNYGHNAGGSDSWRGGLTWVGEAGPELVALPRGSQIYNAQDSRDLGGDTFYISIDASSVKEFNEIVEIARTARARSRMR